MNKVFEKLAQLADKLDSLGNKVAADKIDEIIENLSNSHVQDIGE